MTSLAEGLRRLPPLVHLNILNGSVGPLGMTALLNSIQLLTKNIVVLSLSGNVIGKEGSEVLGAIISRSVSLKTLQLNGAQINLGQVLAGLMSNTSLFNLDIGTFFCAI